MTVLDASAVLAYLQDEPGAAIVDASLAGAVVGAANWSEVLARLDDGVEAALADAVMTARGVRIEPVSKADAQAAARLRRGRPELSLGDRLCLALAERLQVRALTADRAWGEGAAITQIR